MPTPAPWNGVPGVREGIFLSISPAGFFAAPRFRAVLRARVGVHLRDWRLESGTSLPSGVGAGGVGGIPLRSANSCVPVVTFVMWAAGDPGLLPSARDRLRAQQTAVELSSKYTDALRTLVGVPVGVGVGVGVSIGVGVGVGVSTGVGVGVGVAIGLGVAVGIGVGVTVGATVAVAVAVGVTVAVAVGVGVGVGTTTVVRAVNSAERPSAES